MKRKYIILTAVLACLSGLVFAQNVDEYLPKKEPDYTVETIVPEDQHVGSNKTAKVELQYTPGTDEVRLFYTCHAVAFDQGEAMNTAIEVLNDFQKQHEEYYGYKYLKRDTVKYYKDEKTGYKWAMYQSFVKFQR